MVNKTGLGELVTQKRQLILTDPETVGKEKSARIKVTVVKTVFEWPQTASKGWRLGTHKGSCQPNQAVSYCGIQSVSGQVRFKQAQKVLCLGQYRLGIQRRVLEPPLELASHTSIGEDTSNWSNECVYIPDLILGNSHLWM